MPRAKKRRDEQPAGSKPTRDQRMQKITMYTGAAVLAAVLVLVGLNFLLLARSPAFAEREAAPVGALEEEPA